MQAPHTTTKIPSDMHARLLRAAKKTGLKKAELLRLCVEIGVPHIERKFEEMRGNGAGQEGIGSDALGVSLAVRPLQLDEMRELYKSAVTDLVGGVAQLDGKAFVEKVNTVLIKNSATYKTEQLQRIRRFLTVYAQLF